MGFHKWRSREKRLPHSSSNLVEWTHSHNKGVQTASWSAHGGIGGDGIGELQYPCVLEAQVMVWC